MICWVSKHVLWLYNGHLPNIILNVFVMESFFVITKLKGGPHQRQWSCSSMYY